MRLHQVTCEDDHGAIEVLQMLSDYTRHVERRARYKHATTVVNALAKVFHIMGISYVYEITLEGVDNALDVVRDAGASAGTLNHYVGYIRSLFRWAELTGRVQQSPVRGLQKRKGPVVRRRQANSAEEIRLILDAARSGKPYEYPAMMLGFGAGLRQNEILRLRWGDLDLDQGLYYLIDARQKSGKDTVTPLLPALTAYLRELRRERQIELGRIVLEEELVVVGAPRSARTLSSHRKATLRRAGIPFRRLNGEVCDWHSMRHSFITALGDVDIRTKQMLARHADINTTARYDHVDLERQRRGLTQLPEFMPAKRAA